MKNKLLIFGLALFSAFLIPSNVLAYQDVGSDFNYCYATSGYTWYGDPNSLWSKYDADYSRVLAKFGDRVGNLKYDEADSSLSKIHYFSNDSIKKNFVFYSDCIDVKNKLNFDGLELYGYTGAVLDYEDILKQFPYYFYYKGKTVTYDGKSVDMEYFVFTVTKNITLEKIENLDNRGGKVFQLLVPNDDSAVIVNKPKYLSFVKVKDGQSYSLFNLMSIGIAESPNVSAGGPFIPIAGDNENIELKDIGTLSNLNSNMNFTDTDGNTIENNTYKDNDFTNSSTNNKKYNQFNTPTTLDGFLKKVPELIKTLAASFAIIGTMITVVLEDFPPIIVTCLYSTFLLGIIILILKALR